MACDNLSRKSFGFEIKKDFYKDAIRLLTENKVTQDEIKTLGYAKTELSKVNPVFDFS